MMTQREFYKEVLAIEGLSTELKEFAEKAVSGLDKRNEHRRNTLTPAQKENEALKVKILDLLKDGALVASETGKALGVSTQKASSLLRQLRLEGKASEIDLKVKGKGSVKQYSLAESEEKGE